MDTILKLRLFLRVKLTHYLYEDVSSFYRSAETPICIKTYIWINFIVKKLSTSEFLKNAAMTSDISDS